MTKQDLVNEVAKMGMTKKQAGIVVNTILDSIKESLAAGDRVSLVGFGSFSVKKRAAREGRNPRTGKPLKIRAKKVPVFKSGKALKDAV